MGKYIQLTIWKLLNEYGINYFACYFHHNIKSADKENEVVAPKIVRVMKRVLLVSNTEGKVEKYQRVSPKPKKKRVAKRSPKQKKKVSFDEQIAAMTVPCKVAIDRLSREDIDAKIAQVEREGQIRSIKEKIKSLPCKNFV